VTWLASGMSGDMRTEIYVSVRGARGSLLGLTLVELLVVIAVIGVLAALLLAAFGSAHLRAQQIKCLSNVRQLSLAIFMYANDQGRHAGYNPPSFPGGNWMGTLMPYASQNNLRLCPSAPLPASPVRGGNGQGYADRAWVRWTEDGRTMFYGSYGYNGWLYSDVVFRDDEEGRSAQLLVYTRENTLQAPTKTPMFSDENWIDGWPRETDAPARNLYTGRPFDAWGDCLARWTISRHWARPASSAPRSVQPGQKLTGAINMGMADGHAELVKLENLWTYNWHYNWKTPAVRPQ
jgi:prepilin-type N-terminal cleavage/methylation domain-containing protein/prepilin-type processing-associated H-X9-DG protein